MRPTTHGFTLIEVLMVTAIIGLVAAIATPGLLRARIAANEASAIGSLRTINSAQHVFRSSCGSGMFAPSLQNLGLPLGASPGFLSLDLGGPAPVIKSGYRFDVGTANAAPTVSCNGGTTGSGYHTTADPLPGKGRRYFGTNSPAAIFESPATLFAVMPDEGAPPAPAVPLQR